jgi:arginine-tRNA-protein transferase
MSNYSIVEYFGEDEDGGHKCGYCKCRASSLTHGMWGHGLSNQDYQDLIDRGWRRSGKYLYKPVMDRTCCPQYTIRCQVDQFRPSRSHKKVIKRFRSFVMNGRKDEGETEEEEESKDAVNEDEEDGVSEMAVAEARMAAGGARVKLKSQDVGVTREEKTKTPSDSTCDEILRESSDERDAPKKTKMEETGDDKSSNSKVKPGLGADPSKPRARKAKDLRRERAMAKAAEKGKDIPKERSKKHREKSLADFLDEPFPEWSKHRFEVRTVWAQSKRDETFKRTFQESLEVYQKYQIKIHGDKPGKVTADQFTRFLCDASLFKEDRENVDCCEESRSMGGFHQQYLIDGKIFCVGVVDILPHCLSSVYLYYDPAFAFLSPGTLSALFELHFAARAALPFYYMGFYIHDCPKMRYKAALSGSYLLCPERFSWAPVADCVPMLDKSKYSRLSRQGDQSGTEAGELETSNSHFSFSTLCFPTG